jgi:TolB-like protein/predicted Zn-dependent protease
MQPAAQEISACPICGGALEETSGGGLGCMICLLRFGISGEDDLEPSALGGLTAPDDVRFGVYEIERFPDGSLYELGRGAMGVTYRAIDTSLQRKVALKVIKIEVAERSANARARFMREARTAAALRHENVATVFQFGVREETGQCFYAMELIEGETLQERVRRAGPLGLRSTIEIARQVAAALAAAEKRGLVHRDLKPANLMLVSLDDETAGADRKDEKLIVKIIDFGLAKALNAPVDPMSLTRGGFVGTPAFASPEQFEHSALDVRADIYSLGITLWFALTGKTPFAGHSVEEIHRDQVSNVLPVEQLKAARVPSRLRSLLESMLALEPAARPGTHELAARLQRCSAQASGVSRFRIALAAAFDAVRPFSKLSKETPVTRAREKSIAVLPFENFSEDKAFAFFADGMQDEILNSLAKISDLKVISRTSVMQYRNVQARNLPEIAQALKVAHVLEGSVQRSANRVRVSAQLINARDDTHVWVEKYDRELADAFAIQSEIAQSIAESLQAKLTGREEQALAVKPTNNPEAYDAYLCGLASEARSSYSASRDAIRKAIGLYESAVKLDPNFGLGWARLSRAHALLYFSWADTTAARRDAAKSALENAQKLQANAPETQLALGYYQSLVLRDYGLAKTTFRLVSKMLPGSSEVLGTLGAVTRRVGQWDESIAYYEQGLALDPRNAELLNQAAGTYAKLRQFPTALKLYDRALDIVPNDPDLMASKASIYQAQGNLAQAAKALSEINTHTASWHTFRIKITQLRLERSHGEAVRLLQARQASGIENVAMQVLLAFTQRLDGDTVGAKVTAEQVRDPLEALCKNQPDEALFAGALSLANAVLGEKDSALKGAERAVMLLPSNKDRVLGPGFEEVLALTQTTLGENRRAISTLTRLLQTPYLSLLYFQLPVTPELLRLDPLWDPLRADPAFQKLCEVKQPVAPELVTQSAPEKSIAVLPFENFSEDKAFAFFADGMQDEILNSLAKISDLKVISRTSVMQYRNAQARNLPEIAQALKVAHVLEGSVRRSANRVRVSAQLINARDDTHVWVEKYERELTDVFAIQSEIAQAIADQLQAKLSPTEKSAINERPTSDLAAYDLYLQAKEILYNVHINRVRRRENLFKAVEFLDQAVARDPAFLLAYCALSYAHDWIYALNFDHTETRLALAETSLRAAVRLRPHAGETHLAQAFHIYGGYYDYDRAREELAKAQRTLPNNAQIFALLGYIDRRQGCWEEAMRNLEHAMDLNPRDATQLVELVVLYFFLRKYAEATAMAHCALALQPRSPVLRVAQASADVAAEANTAPLRTALNTIEAEGPSAAAEVSDISFHLARWERDPVGAARALANIPREGCSDTNVFPLFPLPHAWYEGLLAKLQKDEPAAHSAFMAARAETEKLVLAQPGNAQPLCVLALIDAELDEKQKAMQEGRTACDMLPRTKDAVTGTFLTTNLARIYALTGENDLALKELDVVSKIPYGPSYGQLRLDPWWDPLRGDPRFEKIVASLAPR